MQEVRNEFSILEMIKLYNNNSLLLILYAIFVIYICIKGTKEQKIVFGYTAIVMGILVFNPLCAQIIVLIGENMTYYRAMWAFPTVLLISYCFVYFVMKQKKIIFKLILIIVLSIAIIFLGNPVATRKELGFPQNIYKIPDEVIQIVDEVKKHNNFKEPILTIMPNEYLTVIRQYDASIQLAYGYFALIDQYYYFSHSEKPDDITLLLNAYVYNKELHPELLRSTLNVLGVQYVVINQNSNMKETTQSAGLELISQISDYLIYYNGTGIK